MIICNKHDIYELAHELLHDLRLRVLRYQDMKYQKYPKTCAQSSSQNNFLFNTSKKLMKIRNRTFPVVPYLT